jgi:cytidyltransferase-like protein
MRVFVSGSFDPLHSGHVAFFKTASRYGDLCVGIGSDESITKYKHPVFQPQEERLYMVRAIRYVKEAWVNSGEGPLDYSKDLEGIGIVIVNEDQHSEEKENLCWDLGIKYIVLKREPEPGLPERHSTDERIHTINKRRA